MVSAMVAPTLSTIDRPFRTTGFLFGSPVEEFLKTKLSQPALSALELITQQMVSEVLQPLLCIPDLEGLRKEFGELFGRFSDLQNSMFYLMYSVIPNIADLLLLSAPALAMFKRALENRGVETIGEEATNDTLLALFTADIVNRRIVKLIDARDRISITEENLRQLHNWITAYNMASLCIWHYFDSHQGLQSNVRVLAYWSRYYAVGMYECAKASRLLEVRAVAGEVAQPDEEDLELAQAGLEDFVTRLAEEEESGT
jgi:hypothetical protein